MSLTLRRLWVQITADRKRFGALCAAVGVGMLLWARLIVVSHVPRTAVADNSVAAAPGRSPAANPRSPGSDKKNSASAVVSKPSTTPIHVVLCAKARRDPFVISPLDFPKPTSSAQLNKDAGKSKVEPVEEAEQIAVRRDAQLLAMATKLKLEAAMGGSAAVIDGRTYRTGEVIAGQLGGGSELVQFRLAEVRQRSVILECEGRRFELQMDSPG